MFKKLFITFAVFLAVTALCVNGAEHKKEQKKNAQKKKDTAITWQADMPKALAAAKKGKKLILLIHIAPQVNNNSKLFNEKIIKNNELGQFAKIMVFVKFEYKDMRDVSKAARESWKKYPLETQGNKVILPTVYLLDSAGNVLEKKVGFSSTNPESYIKSFKNIKNIINNKKKSKKK